MIFGNTVQQCSDFQKLPIQIQRAHTDLVSAYLIDVIQLGFSSVAESRSIPKPCAADLQARHLYYLNE